MKRSEMVDYLEDLIRDKMCGYGASIMTYQVEDILDLLIVKGMLPPVLLKEPLYHESTGRELFQPTEYKWEKE